MSETVTLEFLAAQQRRTLDELASMRDDVRVPTAIVLRHETMLIRLDETLNGVLEQLRAMVAQNARIVDRLRSLDDRVTRLEEHT